MDEFMKQIPYEIYGRVYEADRLLYVKLQKCLGDLWMIENHGISNIGCFRGHHFFITVRVNIYVMVPHALMT